MITGAGRGLGLAIAQCCVARGDRVMGTLREPSRDEGLLALERSAPDRVHVLPLDVGIEADVAALGREVAARTGHVDVLINNAGINASSPDVGVRTRAADLEQLDGGALMMLLRTNAIGPVLVARAARQRGGRHATLSLSLIHI